MQKSEAGKIERLFVGFSLLELMVVVALVAVLIAIALPSIRAIYGQDLKKEITKIAGLTSEIYDLAAISGKTHRVVFDLDNGTFWVEERVGEAFSQKPELGYEELMKERILEQKSETAESGNELIPKFKKISGAWGETIEIPKDMAIYGAWTEQMTQIARSGQVSIYFFSGGYTQDSFVSLAEKGNEEKTAIYLALSPLTGSVSINLGEPNIDDLLTQSAGNATP